MSTWNMQPDLENEEPVLGDMMEYQYWEESQINGYPYKFIKAVETESNNIFNESTARDFLSANGHSIRVKKDDDSMYAGGEMFGGYGYTPSYSNVIYVAVKYFKDITLEPEEGDLFYDQIDKIIFKITKVDTLSETQTNLKINGRVFARKIYLKQYTYSYKDNIDTTLRDEMLTDASDLEELDKLNDTLRTNIDALDVIDNTNVDPIFGELG